MDLYALLKNLNIEYKEVKHDPVFTVEEAQSVKGDISGVGCKSLFLTDKKGHYYLVVLEETKRADMKQMSKLVHTTRLSFASIKELKEVLNLEQGSVTPLGIINDKMNKVTLVIDGDLKNKVLLVHPNTNRRTISISYCNLIKFVEYENHKYIIM